jgi:hypothetical protein
MSGPVALLMAVEAGVPLHFMWECESKALLMKDHTPMAKMKGLVLVLLSLRVMLWWWSRSSSSSASMS